MNTGRYLRILIVLSLGALSARATEYSSSNFQVLDPVQFSGGFSSSASFRLFDALAQFSIGTSTSGTYEVRSGFLYFPAPTPIPTSAPALTPTPTSVSAGGGGIPGFGQPPIFNLPSFFFPETAPPPVKIEKCGTADFNCDSVVDLTDLSIFFYLGGYSSRDNPADLNNDVSINLADVSVMFYYWTENRIFNLAKNIALGYEPPFATLEGMGQAPGFAKTLPRPFVGYQKENGATAEVFGVFEYMKTLVVKTVDIIVNLISRLIGILW